MTRNEFFGSVLGLTAAPKAMEIGGGEKKSLIAIEIPGRLTEANRERARAQLKPYCDKYNFEVLLLDSGVTLKVVA